MSTMPDAAAVEPIALRPGEGESLWFLGQLLTIKASAETSGGGLTLIEAVCPQGPGAPLHVHHDDNEWFYVLEGEMAFWVGGTVIAAPAGSFVFGPRGIPHTFDVVTPEARFLLGADPAGFDRFPREVGVRAETLTLPPPPDGPPDIGALVAAAARFGIEILGPPGFPPS
jgi:quercetin dioxygenase-like cupin family protein